MFMLDLDMIMVQAMFMHNYIGFAFGLDWNNMICSEGVDGQKYEPLCKYIWIGATVGPFSLHFTIRPWGKFEEIPPQ